MLRLVALASIAAGLAMTLAAPSAAQAQEPTFYTVSYVEVGPLLSKVGSSALLTYRNVGRKEPGAVHLEVYQRIDRPNQFTVLGAWTDQKAFETHVAGENNKKLNEKLAALLASPIDTRQHIALTSAPHKSGKDPIVVVTHVDVIPPQKDNGVEAVKKLAEDSRKHAGNLSFEVWQQSNRPNHFTVVEAWANRGAFDLHEMQKDTRDFRTKLGAMSGALYDERLYKSAR